MHGFNRTWDSRLRYFLEDVSWMHFQPRAILVNINRPLKPNRVSRGQTLTIEKSVRLPTAESRRLNFQSHEARPIRFLHTVNFESQEFDIHSPKAILRPSSFLVWSPSAASRKCLRPPA